MKEIAPGNIPWPNPRPRNEDGSFARSQEVDAWFNENEDRFCPSKNDAEVPVWERYAPWKSAIADTMFWM